MRHKRAYSHEELANLVPALRMCRVRLSIYDTTNTTVTTNVTKNARRSVRFSTPRASINEIVDAFERLNKERESRANVGIMSASYFSDMLRFTIFVFFLIACTFVFFVHDARFRANAKN